MTAEERARGTLGPYADSLLMESVIGAIRAAEEEMREAACKAICGHCQHGDEIDAEGKKHRVPQRGYPPVYVPCRAAAIREIKAE